MFNIPCIPLVHHVEIITILYEIPTMNLKKIILFLLYYSYFNSNIIFFIHFIELSFYIFKSSKLT